MTPSTPSTPSIRTIAKAVRMEMTPFVKNNSKHFASNWECACLVSSWTLNKVLNYYGYKTKLVIGEYDWDDHAFVVYQGKAIDITATQFGFKYGTRIKKIHGSHYKILHSTLKSIKKDMAEWPREQVPSTYKKELSIIIREVKRKLDGKRK